MKPLLLLLAVFSTSLLTTRVVHRRFEFALSGRIALSAMLVFTGMAHFVFTKGMSMMLPDFVPDKTLIIYGTGILEIVAAAGLFSPKIRVVTGWLLIAFFILILPANIYAALNHIDYQKGAFDGNGLSYLWFRIPLQCFFIYWTYLFVIKK